MYPHQMPPDHDMEPPEPSYGGVVGEPEDEPLWPACLCGHIEHTEDGECCTLGCDCLEFREA